jgi:hypothetical protein
VPRDTAAAVDGDNDAALIAPSRGGVVIKHIFWRPQPGSAKEPTVDR